MTKLELYNYNNELVATDGNTWFDIVPQQETVYSQKMGKTSVPIGLRLIPIDDERRIAELNKAKGSE